MAIYNSFTIDGVNSLDYGIYTTGEGVFNAPERDVEIVTVPGKNGALILDNGRFENVSVTYKAGCFADSQSAFASKLAAFRSALLSKYNYTRLQDTYNPDEYRLAVYRSGLDVSTVDINRAGEFTIEFDCKPQRFLVSGETPIDLISSWDGLTDENSVALADENGTEIDGGITEITKITNPTDYASQPLITITGPGTLSIGSYIITVSGISETTEVYIDCETMEIYTLSGGVKTSAYSYVSFNTNEFPTIPTGQPGISHTASVSIIPRWWRI